MNYDFLIDVAWQEGLSVKEKPFRTYDGRIKDKSIYIRKDMTPTEKACVLAEDLVTTILLLEIFLIKMLSETENRNSEPDCGPTMNKLGCVTLSGHIRPI